MPKETLNVTPDQVRRTCAKTKITAYCRTSQIGFTVYMEHPNGRRSFHGDTSDEAWLNFAQVLVNESRVFADTLRYFITKDREG